MVCPATRQASTDDRLCDNITNSRKEESIAMPYLSEAGLPIRNQGLLTILGRTNQYLLIGLETRDWPRDLQTSTGRLPECNYMRRYPV